MHDTHRQAGGPLPADTAPDLSENNAFRGESADDLTDKVEDDEEYDDSLLDEVATLIDGGRTYAQAEIAFQKSRAKFAGQAVGMALVQLVLAIILLHIAFLALAVGLVFALTPLVSVWGAIAIVFGGLLVIVALLVVLAAKRAKRLRAAFASGKDEKTS